ncbi:MAG: TRAP transporter small permease subunit [Planctomycetes bacterium]|nr:TRAP transporter small permease subunit [Planctomycetota bacterium]
MARKLNLVFGGTIKFLAFLAGVLLIFMMFSVSLEVVLRYFFDRPMMGLLEVIQVILLYITFLGVAWVLKLEGHAKMDLVLNLLNPRAQSLLNTITSSICAMICLVITWYGALVTWEHLQKGLYLVGVLDIPSGLRLMIIPVGTLLLFIQFLRRTYGYLRVWRAS